MTLPLNSLLLQQADAGTPLEVRPPVLFNTFKHHAGAVRGRIRSVVAAGPAALEEFAASVAVLGAKLMDFYTGSLTPLEISAHILDGLHRDNRLALEDYRAWLAEREDYAVVALDDDSRWVLRLADEQGRYVHLHPARWSPNTLRVRANVLKTAFLVLAHVRLFGGDPMDRAVINAVRRKHLGLSPIGQDPEGEVGLGAILEVLRREGDAAG
jgi:hypothetical protein